MTIRCDEDLVLAKIATVRRCVATIRRLWREQQPAVEDWVRLEQMSSTCSERVRLALVWATSHPPQKLGAAGFRGRIDPACCRRGTLRRTHVLIHRRLMGSDNIGGHNDRDIDEQIVTTIVHNHLKDLENFASPVVHATL